MKLKLLMPFLFFSNLLMAQQVVSLEEAISIAKAENGKLKAEALQAKMQQALIAAYKEIPATDITSELGQVNSAYFDAKLGIQQTFLPGKYYRAQKQVYQTTYELAEANRALSERQIIRLVTFAYADYVFQSRNLYLLMKMDSIYSGSLQRAKTRFNAGEDNGLEFSTAELYQTKNNLRISQHQMAGNMALVTFRVLLNSDIAVPDTAGTITAGETAVINEAHPQLAYYKAQKQKAIAGQKLESSKLLPNYNIGYINNSFKGIGPDNKTYDLKHRFHNAVVGMQLPIFNKAQKAKVKALALEEDIADAQYSFEQKQMDTQLKSLLERQKKLGDMVSLFKQDAVSKTMQIISLATRQLENGEINYLQWARLTNDATEHAFSYFELLKQLQETNAELQYLTNP